MIKLSNAIAFELNAIATCADSGLNQASSASFSALPCSPENAGRSCRQTPFSKEFERLANRDEVPSPAAKRRLQPENERAAA